MKKKALYRKPTVGDIGKTIEFSELGGLWFESEFVGFVSDTSGGGYARRGNEYFLYRHEYTGDKKIYINSMARVRVGGY